MTEIPTTDIVVTPDPESPGCVRIDFPNGTTCWYEDEKHAYFRHNPKTGRRGRKALGVTTAVKTLDTDPSQLMKWAAKHQVAGVVRWLRRQLLAGMEIEEALAALDDPDDAYAMLESAKLSYREVNQKAKDTGDVVHGQAFERLAKGEIPDLRGMSDREIMLSRAAHGFFVDHHLDVILTEQVVYSETLGVAGQPDVIARLEGGCADESCPCHEFVGEVVVIDLKTGNFIAPSLHAQVGGGYPLLAAECRVADPVGGLIVKVRDDGTYTVLKAAADRMDFETAAIAYRTSTAIASADRKAYNARKGS